MIRQPGDNDASKIITAGQWSDIDMRDLRSAIGRGNSVADIASRLCRTRREVEDKARELGWITLLAKR